MKKLMDSISMKLQPNWGSVFNLRTLYIIQTFSHFISRYLQMFVLSMFQRWGMRLEWSGKIQMHLQTRVFRTKLRRKRTERHSDWYRSNEVNSSQVPIQRNAMKKTSRTTRFQKFNLIHHCYLNSTAIGSLHGHHRNWTTLRTP